MKTYHSILGWQTFFSLCFLAFPILFFFGSCKQVSEKEEEPSPITTPFINATSTFLSSNGTQNNRKKGTVGFYGKKRQPLEKKLFDSFTLRVCLN